jgi:integrase
MNFGQDQIARSCAIDQATVHRYLQRAEAARLTWPLPDDYDDGRLNELLFRPGRIIHLRYRGPVWTWQKFHRQLQANLFVTLQLLWKEYREKQSGGYSYSRFLRSVPALVTKLELVLRQEHRAGIRDEKKGPLFRSVDKRRTLTLKPIARRDVLKMIKRRALAAGLPYSTSCHTFRVTGITEYLRNVDTLEKAQTIANHESAKTTKRNDRQSDEISLQ